MSFMVTKGKLMPYGLPVLGSIEAGPVEPLQPPNTLLQTTKYLSVSIPLPGPTRLVHQPPTPETCESPVSAWQTRMALDLSTLSSPKVSYASVIGPSFSPDSNARSCGGLAKV